MWHMFRIARNKENFVTWSEHQNLEEVSLGDLPTDLGQHASVIFDVTGQLSKAWIKDVRRRLCGNSWRLTHMLAHWS